MAGFRVPRLDRVVVSVDFAEPSVTAARWVATHFAPEAEIILAHIIEPPPATRASVMRYPSMETIVGKVHVEVEIRLQRLCESIAPGRARPEIRVGTPHDELVTLTSIVGADLMVVGRQDLTSSGWARIGATAQRVLRKSNVPILLVAGANENPPSRILIAIDESDTTDDVLGWGAFLSSRFSADSTVMHAAGVDSEDDGDSWIDEQLQKVAGASTMAQRVTRTSIRPAESVIAEARDLESELVVIGSRGAGSADQLLFGSVAESVLLSSPCPVLVVIPR